MARVKEQINQVSAMEDNDLQNQPIAQERAKQQYYNQSGIRTPLKQPEWNSSFIQSHKPAHQNRI